jgi:hypothetical protein
VRQPTIAYREHNRFNQRLILRIEGAIDKNPPVVPIFHHGLETRRLFFRRLASASSRIALRISWRSKESGGLTGSKMTGLRFVFVAMGSSGMPNFLT